MLGAVKVRAFNSPSPSLRAVFVMRTGGVSRGPYAGLNLGDHVGDDASDVFENRRRLIGALDIESCTVMDQRHTANVREVDETLSGRGFAGNSEAQAFLGSTDGLVTGAKGVSLAVMVADCRPVVIFDPVNAALGVAHCGRAGLTSGLLANVFDEMRLRYGSVADSLHAGVGPGIARDSYEVGPAQVREVRSSFGEAADNLLVSTREGHAFFDLAAATKLQLERLGVPSGSIEVMSGNTFDDEDFFSDRRERPCGRHMLVASLG